MINKPGPIARRAVADAIANIGISEIGPPYENRGTAIDHYNIAAGNSLGDPWCAAFVFVRQTVAASDLKTPLPADFPGPDKRRLSGRRRCLMGGMGQEARAVDSRRFRCSPAQGRPLLL